MYFARKCFPVVFCVLGLRAPIARQRAIQAKCFTVGQRGSDCAQIPQNSRECVPGFLGSRRPANRNESGLGGVCFALTTLSVASVFETA